MPGPSGGAPYPYPIFPASPSLPPMTTAGPLTIDVWHGLNQTFGRPGTPQQWVNILGSVSGPTAGRSLTYSLNGGPERGLTVGPDRQRVYGLGDFNVEIDRADLRPLPDTNRIVITATADGGQQARTTVTVSYDATAVWPLPYTIDWSAASSVQAMAQVVDGRWAIRDGTLQNVVPGYDRLVAIGDLTWTGYEITVPVTVHALNTAEWRAPSNGAGVGIIARWQGHYRVENEQPRLGWRTLGALAWYHWGPNGVSGYQLRGYRGWELVSRSDRHLQLNTPYVFKLRVEPSSTAGRPATYRFKVWRAGEPEPPVWFMESVGREGEPAFGSLLLVAHQALVTFGDVSVQPLDGSPPPPPANRTVLLSPKKALNLNGTALVPGDVTTNPQIGVWEHVFRAADHGLSRNLSAFAYLPGGDLLMSFAANQVLTMGGVSRTVTPWDVVRFNPATPGEYEHGTFSFYLQGKLTGLSTTAEKIDALAVGPDGGLLISTAGTAAVKGAGGATVRPADEDLIRYNGPGEVWSIYFDGSTVAGLATEDVIGASVDAVTGDVYLSLQDGFTVGGVKGGAKDILRLRPTAGGYTIERYWSAGLYGFPGTFDAIEVTP